MKNSRFIYLSVLSGLLLASAWFEFGTGLVLLFAFIPLLFVEDYFYRNRQEHRNHKVLLMSAISFFTWNLVATWWLWNATIPGMFVALLINTLLMSTIFWLFHIARRNTGDGPGYFALVVFWLVYEHFYMNGEVNWPWLNLGNGFANDIHLVQWYEFTGTFGGTFWVLLVNILAFPLLKHIIRQRNLSGKVGAFILLCSLIFIPIIISLVIFKTYTEKEDPREMVILQPNIDPYEEKFGGMPMEMQMEILMDLADSLTTPNTDYIVSPETFVYDNVWASDLYTNQYVDTVHTFLLRKNPGSVFILGIMYYELYLSPEEITPTAREISGGDAWYDSYNAAIQVDTSMIPQVYNKSKLVIGVETMPYPQYLGFLKKLMVRLGGTFRSHGTQEKRGNLYTHADSVGIAPVICYESIFGDYVNDYIRGGANYIFVITNDGWWGDTPGYRQHHSYSRLRAIETRRSIARSANTGISSFINQKGEILQKTDYWVPAALRGEINANDALTFYVRHGDYIARIAYFFSLLVVMYTITRVLITRKK